MSTSKGVKQNNEYGISDYDPLQFAISNGILTKYLGNALSVSVPSCVSQISSSAFMGCSNVSEIIIADSVHAIDRYAFVSCTSLKNVRLGFGISVVPMGAFADLPSLESVVLTDSISEIENFAFRNCKKLNSIEFLTKKYRDPVTAAEKGKAFEMMIAGKPAKIEYIDYLEEPPILASIGNYAFYGCVSLNTALLKTKAKKSELCAFDDSCAENKDSSKGKTSSEAWTHDEYSLWVDAIIRINDKSKHAPAVDITEEARSREDELAEKEEIGEEDIDTLSKESEIAEAPDDGCEDSSKDKTSSDAWIPDEECSPADAIIEINEKNEYVSDVDITEGEYAKEAEAEEKEVIGGECIDTLSKESEIAEAPDDGCEDSSKDKTSSEIWIPDEEYSPADAIIEINEKNNYAPDFDKTEGEHSEEDEVAEKEEIGGEDIDTLSTESEIAEAPDENCEDSNEYTIAPEYDVIDSAITHVTSGEVSEDAPAVKNIEDYSSLLGASQIKEEAEVIEICSFDNCFSEINTVIDDYSAMEAELDNGVYGSEDDKYFKNTDEKVIKSIDIESTEEKHPKNEINEKEEHIYAEESSKVPGGDIVSAEPTEETGKKYLVNGFTVEDGKIRNEASQRIIRDAPVEILSLSTWTYNAIYRTKEHIMEAPHEIVMISDLLKLSPEQLRRLHNLGAKSAEEIIERVSAYLCSDMNNEEKNGVDKQYSIAPDYEVIDGIITHTGSGHAVEDVFIDNIGLGVRVTNSLHRRQIMKLSELICLSVQQLKEFPNMGAKSISEILETVPRYLGANQVTELPTYVPAKVDIPPLDSEYAVLASDYAVANGVIYHRKTLKIIPDISVERLDLSFRALNCLIRNGNDRVSSLVGMPFRDFRSIRNLGQRSANEIQEKLELYLDNSEKQAVLASSVSTEQILSVMHSHEFEPIDLDVILQTVPDATEDGVKAILANLVDSQGIMQDEGTFAIKHVSFFEAVNESFLNNYYQSGDERAARILQQRASGKTLEEVGRQEGMTRERIRQIEAKALRKLRHPSRSKKLRDFLN